MKNPFELVLRTNVAKLWVYNEVKICYLRLQGIDSITSQQKLHFSEITSYSTKFYKILRIYSQNERCPLMESNLTRKAPLMSNVNF